MCCAVTMAMAVISVVQTIPSLMYKVDDRKFKKQKSTTTRSFMAPLPKRYMVMDTPMIHDHYWGTLIKLGYICKGWLLFIDQFGRQTYFTLKRHARTHRIEFRRNFRAIFTCGLIAAASIFRTVLAMDNTIIIPQFTGADT